MACYQAEPNRLDVCGEVLGKTAFCSDSSKSTSATKLIRPKTRSSVEMAVHTSTSTLVIPLVLLFRSPIRLTKWKGAQVPHRIVIQLIVQNAWRLVEYLESNVYLQDQRPATRDCSLPRQTQQMGVRQQIPCLAPPRSRFCVDASGPLTPLLTRRS